LLYSKKSNEILRCEKGWTKEIDRSIRLNELKNRKIENQIKIITNTEAIS